MTDENTTDENTTPEAPEATGSASALNQAVESVMALINAMGLFATITRGALGTAAGLCCEVGSGTPETVWMDKNQYIPVDLTINGKHPNLLTLSDAENAIHEKLTMMRSYPGGETWQITDIATASEPQVIGRETDNQWVMASSLTIRLATGFPEPEPEPGSDSEPEQQ